MLSIQRFMMAHTRWLPARQKHLVPHVKHIQRIVRIGGCPRVFILYKHLQVSSRVAIHNSVIMQSTGSIYKVGPGFNSRRVLPFYFSTLLLPISHNTLKRGLSLPCKLKLSSNAHAIQTFYSQAFSVVSFYLMHILIVHLKLTTLSACMINLSLE